MSDLNANPTAPNAHPEPHVNLAQQPEIEARISAILSQNRRSATPFTVTKHSTEAAKNWDKFYKNHQDKFFKDRHWTSREFASQIGPNSSSTTGKGVEEDREEEMKMISDITTTTASSGDGEGEGSEGGGVLLEVGCGVGNMLYPLLETNSDLKVHCCDFSSRAIDIVKNHPLYNPSRVNAFVFDLTQSSPPLSSHLDHSEPYTSWPSISTISLIFVLSAIPPDQHFSVLSSLVSLLTPQGGHILFRDYAHGDLSQVRYHTKKDASWSEPSLLSPNPDEHAWYKRGDNTFNYFFKQDYLQSLASQLGLQGEVQVLRRTAVNRKSEVNMQRRFVQARWYVPPKTQV